AGGTNAAVQAGLDATKYTSDPHEVLQAGLLGFSLGAPLGGLAGRLARTAHDGFVATTLRKAQEDGHVLTSDGEIKLNAAHAPYQSERPLPNSDEEANAFLGGSVGSAQTAHIPEP